MKMDGRARAQTVLIRSVNLTDLLSAADTHKVIGTTKWVKTSVYYGISHQMTNSEENHNVQNVCRKHKNFMDKILTDRSSEQK